MLSPIWAVKFINEISRSSWTWHNLWKLLTINFRNKYFHNSVDWSVLYLQVYIPSCLAKFLRFSVFRLLENNLWKSLALTMMQFLTLHVEQPSNKLTHNNLPPSAMKNFPPWFMGQDTMPLLHWKTIWRCIPQYLQESA